MQAKPMPVAPKAFLMQLYTEVIVNKVPTGTYKNGDDFFEKLR